MENTTTIQKIRDEKLTVKFSGVCQSASINKYDSLILHFCIKAGDKWRLL